MDNGKIAVDDKMAELIANIKTAIANVIDGSEFGEPTPENNNLIVNVLLHIAADYFGFICALNKIKDDAISDAMVHVGMQYEKMFRNSLNMYRNSSEIEKMNATAN